MGVDVVGSVLRIIFQDEERGVVPKGYGQWPRRRDPREVVIRD